jgi:hypothetical protein
VLRTSMSLIGALDGYRYVETSELVLGRVYFKIRRAADGALPSVKLFEYVGPLHRPQTGTDETQYLFVDCANDISLRNGKVLIGLGCISSEREPSGPREAIFTETDVHALLSINQAFRALGIKHHTK